MVKRYLDAIPGDNNAQIGKKKEYARVSKSNKPNINIIAKSFIKRNIKEFLDSYPSMLYNTLATKVPTHRPITVPYINDKSITLTNAGLATGAKLSTNLLDTIAKYAERAKLPIDTAVGLAIKESTLGNPTDDKTFMQLIKNDAKRKYFQSLYDKNGGALQHINQGVNINGQSLINMWDDYNPYYDALSEAERRTTNLQDFNNRLMQGLRYANRKAINHYFKGDWRKNYLQAGFEKYKKNPQNYNNGQKNYEELVNARSREIANSPEYIKWKTNYLQHKRKAYGGIVPIFATGGTIHINPANRGKFNALKKRTGKTTEELTHSKNPLTRKRAIFAQNARKWKH